MLYRPLQRKISELKVYCVNRERGCEEIMKLGEMETHLSAASINRCDFILLFCPNGCEMMLLRKDLDAHVNNNCSKRKETCSYCKLETRLDLLNEHLDVCVKVPVPCPRSCEMTLLRGDLQEHEGICPNVLVKCPLYGLECETELCRRDLVKHVEENSASHLIKCMEGYKVLKTDTEAVRKELKELKSQASMAVTRITECSEMLYYDLRLAKPLEALSSSLKGYQLNFAGDIITFAVPDDIAAEEWESPLFTIAPGYQFHMTLNGLNDTVELKLLSGRKKELLAWPPVIGHDITSFLFLKRLKSRHPHPYGVERVLMASPSTFNMCGCSTDVQIIVSSHVNVDISYVKYLSVKLSESSGGGGASHEHTGSGSESSSSNTKIRSGKIKQSRKKIQSCS